MGQPVFRRLNRAVELTEAGRCLAPGARDAFETLSSAWRSTKRLNNIKPFLIGGFSTSFNLASNEDNPEDNATGTFRSTSSNFNYELGFGIDIYLYYFKFTPSIRGVFGLNDQLVRNKNPNSGWTKNIEKMTSRGVFINFTIQ